ncbi:hypothetical protein PRIPAC_76992 [Pristionchus pacificus]|uniref:SHSP domain-containing protein n=1 Tax=Pristionchus pacificus TaxID=54126 RepID=A0A2A6CMD9_PRIPA|nr:hypothetical protein PRIPAC_76992 [Pristionchus pacificus]|eukprot:PDM79191.1 hypothetical protein PRIPAC_31770 [Pristionchus pacificus]
MPQCFFANEHSIAAVAFHRPIDRLMGTDMDLAFRHPFWMNPFTSVISSLDLLQLPPLIVTENGTKKFKLDFDVSKFKPEELRVKTAANENTLQVEAKHEDETCKFEFSRTITVPSGTTLAELKCRFSSDGTLTLEAPFVPPIEEKNEAIQDTDIPVQHT